MHGFAVLCPGQGVQHPGMFGLIASHPPLLQQACRWLDDAMPGIDLEAVLQSPQQLFSGRLAQPLIIAASLAVWEGLRNELPPPSLVAGYSVGEVAACSVACGLLPSQAVQLAVRRADVMQSCVDRSGNPQGMLAVTGARRKTVEEGCRQHQAFIAIVTGPDACIVGGSITALERLAQGIAMLGATARLLPVPVASHTPLMQEAVIPFQESLHNLAPPMQEPASGLVSSLTGDLLASPEEIRQNLVRQLHQTIEWATCMDTLAERGTRVVLELGPGNSLTRLLQARHPGIEVRSASDFRTIPSIIRWIRNR